MTKKIRFVFKKKKYRLSVGGKYLLICLGITGGLLISELVLRHIFNFDYFGPYLKFRHNIRFSIPESALSPDLFWQPRPQFRGVEYAPQKDENSFRIICLGDSVTKGHGQDDTELPVSQAYPSYLESAVKDKIKKKQVEVINAGVGGYTSLQGLRYLNKTLIHYDPDLLIVWFGPNDNSSAIFFSDNQQKIPTEEDLKKLNIWEKSALFLFFKKELGFKPKHRVYPEDYFENCKKILLAAEKQGFEIVFVAPLNFKSRNLKYYEEYKNSLKNLETRYGARVIYLKAAFEEYGKVDDLFLDECHLTPKGNKLAAGLISEQIDKSVFSYNGAL